jgi:hypothetical protein
MKKLLFFLCVAAVGGLSYLLFGSLLSIGSLATAQVRADCATVPGVLPEVVPQPYNSTFTEASAYYQIDPDLEAAIFLSEHSNSWPNSDGPWARSPKGAVGPFQFMPGTWAAYGDSNPKNPFGDPKDLTDAAYAAAHYLKDLGGSVNMPAGDPMVPERGTVAWVAGAYNGGQPIIGDSENDSYRVNAVTQYLALQGKSASEEDQLIPNDTCVSAYTGVNSGSALELMSNPNITFTHPGPELNDLASGRISPRLIALLTRIASTHRISIFALASDHTPGTNHEAGRAADIWEVDGVNCYPPRKAGACWRLAQDLDAIQGCLQPTELIYYYDPGPSPYSFARSDHNDHVHVGYDGPLGPKHYSDDTDPCSAEAITGSP